MRGIIGSMNPALARLQARGFIRQCTDLSALSARMDAGPLTFYVGVDPTGSSLHVGHMLPMFALKHLCDAGHRGCVLIGGGTARIGDPSGKTSMRKMLDYATLDAYAGAIVAQLDHFLSFDHRHVFYVNNRDWLAHLNYIDFLREVGAHFSVNKMLTYEAYKKRLETGLSFLEFNYQLLQSYDFLTLSDRYAVELQIGGDDQWGNIVAGADLVRRVRGKTVHGLTFPLITRADGQKMGKTEQGALFLDPALVSPYDFFQYWRNTPDEDVRRFLLLFTFLFVRDVEAILTQGINCAKELLAYEVTRLMHGTAVAQVALQGARAAFGGCGDKCALPTFELTQCTLQVGIKVTDLFVQVGLCTTKSDARRLIAQGGAFVGLQRVADIGAVIDQSALDLDGTVIVRAGKKRVVRIVTDVLE